MIKVHKNKQCKDYKYQLRFSNFFIALDDRELFTDINLDIFYSNIVLIKGGVGTGKSTLLKAIAGNSIVDYKGNINHANLYNQVLSPIYIHSNPELNFITGYIDDELSLLNITNKSLFNDYIGKSIYELSGGQLKKISLLMAMYYTSSNIILADEPLEMLDDIETNILVNNIIEYSSIKPFIITTHDEYFDSIADIIIYIN